MKDIYENLKNKGWNHEEIQRAMTIIRYGKSNQKNLFFQNKTIIYWVTLFVLTIFNIILSLMLVPFFIFFQHSFVYVFIVIFACGFGYVFNFLLKDIEFSDPRHHIIAGLFIPAIAIINIYIVINLTNYFIQLSKINQLSYNPYITSFIYVISFMIPYVYTRVPHGVDKVIRKTYKTN